MITLNLEAPRRRERHNYTHRLTAAFEEHAQSGAYGAALGAVEIAASMYARAFAVASVEPDVPAVTPEVRATIARRLIMVGESLHAIDVDGGAVGLREVWSWSVPTGGPDPRSWRYWLTEASPAETSGTHRMVPADQVVHCRYATLGAQPWQGIAPLTLAGTTGRLARDLEQALLHESRPGPVGTLFAMPQDAGDESDDPDDPDDQSDPYARLKAQLNDLRGRIGLVETTSAGQGEGRAAAPAQDWVPRRIGPVYTPSEVELRQRVEESVLSVCGIPPGLARAEGGESRESYRRWYAASVLPLARIVEHELSAKLDVPDLRLDFGSLAAADVHGRARAWRSLAGNEATIPADEARRIVGL